MAGDGSLFGNLFADAVQPLMVEFFATSLTVTYRPPNSTEVTELQKMTVSDEMSERIVKEHTTEIEKVRYAKGVVNSESPQFCGVEKFQQLGVVSIDGIEHTINQIKNQADGSQELRLIIHGIESAGSPYRR